MRRIICFIWISLILMVGISLNAFAGGPFTVDTLNDSGVALRWANDTLEWYADMGQLSSTVSNTTAISWVQDAFDRWSSIQLRNSDMDYVNTVSLTITYKGKVSNDITVSNYSPYIAAEAGDTVVIFDNDGSITADLMGDANKDSIVGLSAPVLSDSSGLYITKGFSIFNGYVLSENKLSSDSDTAQSLFKGTMLHELGHLINLDHTQINDDIAQTCSHTGTIYERNGSCDDGQYIPTMYPELLSTQQGELSRDDKIAVSWLYPTSDFTQDFCIITGKIYDGDGSALKGVNVIASRSGEGDTLARQDARSFVSGVLHSGCDSANDSTYYLYGIVPGHYYDVRYEPINSSYTGASGFEPLDNPPSGFDSGTIKDVSGNTTVKCDKGGETIHMADVTISTTNPCTGGGTGGGGTTTSSSSGGCSLVYESELGAGLSFLIMFMVLSVLFARRKSL